MENSSPASLLENPYYFCESGKEASWKEVAIAIGEGLHKAGKIKDPTPKTLPEDLYGDVFAECKCSEMPTRLRGGYDISVIEMFPDLEILFSQSPARSLD